MASEHQAPETVLGMPLEGENDITQPLAALVVVKGIDSAGNVAYWARATPDVTAVECYGMALYAAEELRLGFGE